MRGAEHDRGVCPLVPANTGGLSRTSRAGLPRGAVKHCGSCRKKAGQFQPVFIRNRNETAPAKKEEGSCLALLASQGRTIINQLARAGRQAGSRTENALHQAVSPLQASRYSWSLEKGEVTNPPGFSSAPGTEIPDPGRSCRRELSFAILCKGKCKPNPSQWEEE